MVANQVMNFFDNKERSNPMVSQRGLVLTVLDGSRPPNNGRQIREEIMTYLACYGAEYLLEQAFNVSTRARSSGDHMARLLAARSRNEVKLEADVAAAAAAASGGGGDGGLDAASAAAAAGGGGRVYGIGGRGGTRRLIDGQVRFRDAISYEEKGIEEPEPGEDRVRRMKCWNVLTTCFSLHPQLFDPSVCENGNIIQLMDNFMELISVHEKESALDIFVKVGGLKARGKTYKAFMTEVQCLKADIDRIEDPDYRVSEKVLTQFVLRAMGEVAEYQVEVGLLRKLKEEPSLMVVLTELDARSMRTGNKSMGGISGMVGESGDGLTGFTVVGGGSRGGAKGGRACWTFCDTGACKFGDSCRFVHYKKGQCYECGSRDHGRDKCPLYKDRVKFQESWGKS